jgi:hypothetical protein
MMGEIERLRNENYKLKNDNKVTQISVQKENAILKTELQ